jgi:hypothetical protein
MEERLMATRNNGLSMDELLFKAASMGLQNVNDLTKEELLQVVDQVEQSQAGT